jgi:hypothetical protein
MSYVSPCAGAHASTQSSANTANGPTPPTPVCDCGMYLRGILPPEVHDDNDGTCTGSRSDRPGDIPPDILLTHVSVYTSLRTGRLRGESDPGAYLQTAGAMALVEHLDTL